MRWHVAMGLALLLMAAPLRVQGDAGRAAPECLTQTATSLPPSLAIDPDVCVIVDLGLLTPGDVYDLSIIIVDDAIDLLFFDENSVQPYELGQSYRSLMAQPASTESALGAYEFHWKVPPSITGKRWYMVLDNTAHDGDAGQGDQGGLRSTVSASVDRLDEAYWTPYHDVLSVDAGSYEVLLSGDDLRLDAGTTLVLSAWELSSVGDVYLQTRTMHDRYQSGSIGVQFIDGGALQAVTSPQSLTWQVPSTLEGEELLLVVDNTDSPLGGGDGTEVLRMTVRLELAPPLTPTVTDDQMSSVALGASIQLDASSTPNRLGQQGTFVWDFDDSVDTDNDGNPTNDNDASGVMVDASWDLPGEKTLTVVMTAPSGQQASAMYTVNVNDVVPPVPRIQTDGSPVADGWRVNVDNVIVLNCASSSDDHTVASCDWTVDGQPQVNTSTLTLSPDTVRTYEVRLTVKDASGNSANITTTIASVDPSVPYFEQGFLDVLPTKATEGDELTLEVAVNDSFDGPSPLRVHWDLQPNKDTDGNGDARDDPDRVGLNPLISFDDAGLREIVITVFDASNNSDTHAFSVDVSAAPSTTPPLAGGALVIGVITLLVVGGLVGFRTVQRSRGFNLLIQQGLSSEEARAHMAKVAQQNKVGLFATSEAHAGLDIGVKIVSAEERQAAQAQAEMEAIYGTAATADPNAGFAPPAYSQQPLSQASSQAAAEAAALLGGDEDPMTGGDAFDSLVEDIAGAAAVAVPATSTNLAAAEPSSGVALPVEGNLPESVPVRADVSLPATETPVAASVAIPEPSPTVSQTAAPTPPPPPAPVVVRHTCTSCSAVFEIDMPAGLSRALVACPACGADQTVALSV